MACGGGGGEDMGAAPTRGTRRWLALGVVGSERRRDADASIDRGRRDARRPTNERFDVDAMSLSPSLAAARRQSACARSRVARRRSPASIASQDVTPPFQAHVETVGAPLSSPSLCGGDSSDH